MAIASLRFSRASQILFSLLLVACLCSAAYAERRDAIVMKNGDHITGKIKRLQDGLLYVETDYVTGNIALDWKQVKSIQSKADYKVVLNDGRRFEGKIEKFPDGDQKAGDFLIHEAKKDMRISSTEIASIDHTKPTFWRQLEGSIDLGYSFAGGNSQTTMNLDASAAYKTPGWQASLAFDSTFSGQSGASKTNREDIQAAFAKFLNRNSFVGVLSDFLHSSQQDLDLRTTFGGGYGRFLERTTDSNLSWMGGLVYANEAYGTAAGQPSDNNMEGILMLQYNLTRFNFGSFDAQLMTFPGLTDSGRMRLQTNDTLAIKLRNNFQLNFTFWDNFDSQPPPTAKKNEFDVSTGIGWTF